MRKTKSIRDDTSVIQKKSISICSIAVGVETLK